MFPVSLTSEPIKTWPYPTIGGPRFFQQSGRSPARLQTTRCLPGGSETAKEGVAPRLVKAASVANRDAMVVGLVPAASSEALAMNATSRSQLQVLGAVASSRRLYQARTRIDSATLQSRLHQLVV
jgi:hypothetical protein